MEVGNPTIPKSLPLHRHHNWFYGDAETVEATQIPPNKPVDAPEAN
jgi:hypothetical protein